MGGYTHSLFCSMEGTHLSLAEQLSRGILIDSLAYVDKEVVSLKFS